MQLENILQKASAGQPLGRKEVMHLLSLTTVEDLSKLFSAARRVRERFFSNKIFLYGFVYFSTYCKNNCSFCFYRQSNELSPRYRKTTEETVKISRELAESGVHLIDLTMGEDPYFSGTGEHSLLAKTVRAVKDTVGLPVMVSPGLLGGDALLALRSAGADWYALYQETHNRRLYSRLRLGQSYNSRLASKAAARNMGYLIEEGILLGVGEATEDIAHSIITMKKLGVHQARVMSLVPQRGTPLELYPSPPALGELVTIAVLRLTLGNVLIPASLDVDGIKGLQTRLEAGANVVTSIIPPRTGLAGVSQSQLDIEEGFRTVAGVKKVLSSLSLEQADQADYVNLIQRRQNAVMEGGVSYENSYHRRAASGN